MSVEPTIRRISMWSYLAIALVYLFLFAPCGLSGQPATWTNPVIAGDHPDPSVVRLHGEYLAATTSGNRTPGFPLFRSHDLVHWQPAGSIFPVRPSWIEGDLWAPELVADRGSLRVYYAAREKQGPLCVGAATASNANADSWTDHGPIVCQPDGSIDPSFIRDEHGSPYLIWKEDGNSVGQPTYIWAQRLDESGLHVQDQPHKLIRNDEPWEGLVVEGPYIFRHRGRFYMLYAGGFCCGNKCTYAEGEARATRLLGPWEKDPQNPIIAGNARWLCPGHGTAVVKGHLVHRIYLLLHAYPGAQKSFASRETILTRLVWRNGWLALGPGTKDIGGKQGAGTTSP
jgi:xylan 1,4-beta-xylosidase